MYRHFLQMRTLRLALCAVIMLAGSAAAALAQGLYYKEVRKDGRIYVFNVAANADRFDKSGEMGVGITKPGVGPNGETVVGDNERALQLFFFKHGISEPVADPVQPIQTLVWRDGKTRITTDNAYIEISNRVQVRFTQDDPVGSSRTIAGTSGAGQPLGSFRIRRAKFKVEGWMIRPWLTYETQVNYPALNGGNIGALLEDAAFDVDFSKGAGLFRVHVGQFKPAYGAQEMTSSGSQQFVDRALASNAFFRGRETGVAIWGATRSNKFEWRFHMSNGNSMTRVGNDNNAYQFNGRLMWQPNGSQVLNQRAWVSGPLYSESDFESTTTPIYAVAVNFERQDNFFATTGNDQKWNAVSVDGIYKFKGFSANGMYTMARRTPETGAKFDAAGSFIQVGKLFHRRQYEVATRYGWQDPSDITANNQAFEYRLAFSYYYARHGLKWQTDVGQVATQGTPQVRSNEIRSQVQFIF